MFDSFIKQLKKRLLLPLPGEDAQFLMSPMGRERSADFDFTKTNPKKSAVLILIFPQEKTIKTTFIVRPIYDGIHSGQISFPGGKYEDSDTNLEHTALRETFEEVGIKTNEINILGKLTDLYVSPSNFLICPYIGFINSKPLFKADQREVAKILTFDIFELNNKNIKDEKLITIGDTFEIKAPYYNLDGHTLWGATAMIVSELNILIEEAINQ